jgi:hypothetical protein
VDITFNLLAIERRVVDKHLPMDFWLAVYITKDDVTARLSIEERTVT